MSDYTKTTNFTTKDNLSTGNALKVVKGSYFDTEYDAIAIAIATKYDSGNLASQAEAEGLTLDTVIITPHSLNDVLVDNGGMLANIQALADPGVDAILGWDNSATDAIAYTIGAGLSHAGTEIDVAAAIAGTGLTMTTSVLNVIGGDGITANANDVAVTAAAASSSLGVAVVAGVINLDCSSLTELVTATALAATDRIYIDDAGVPKAVEIQNLGMRVLATQTTGTLTVDDMNSIMPFEATATLTIPLNATTALPVGVPIVLNVKHATQVLTVTADTSVTLVTTNHPGGGSAASDTVQAGGTALLYQVETDVWALSGNIVD